MDVVFWQNSPSPHQMPTLRAFADLWPGKVSGVFDRHQNPKRKMLGWSEPELGPIEPVFLEDVGNSAEAVQEKVREKETIHVLSGFRGCFSSLLAWRHLRGTSDSQIAVMAERLRRQQGLRRLAQRGWYKWQFGRYGDRIKALLAFGSITAAEYEQLGCRESKIFPYIYAVPTTGGQVPVSGSQGIRHCLYLGRLDPMKGVLELCAAVRATADIPLVKVDFVGPGPSEEVVKETAAAADGRCRYLGLWEQEQVIPCMRGYDVLLMPSYYDGWGCVINEALEAGLGVVTTEMVGAKDLVRASGAGFVLPEVSSSALERVIRDLAEKPHLVQQWKGKAAEYRRHIRPNRVASYLAEVLDYVFIRRTQGSRPTSPWLRGEGSLAEVGN